MLRKTSIFLNTGDMKKVADIGKVRGLRPAQLVRIAIAEWLHRTARQSK
jgi:hypothetical protein